MTVGEARLLAEAVDAAVAVCARVEQIAATSESCALLLLVAEGHRDALESLRSQPRAPADEEARRLAVAAEVLAELKDVAAAAAEHYREALGARHHVPRPHGNHGPLRPHRPRGAARKRCH